MAEDTSAAPCNSRMLSRTSSHWKLVTVTTAQSFSMADTSRGQLLCRPVTWIQGVSQHTHRVTPCQC